METKQDLEHIAQTVAQDQLYCWHPYTQAFTAKHPLPIESAHKAELYLSDGSAYIDAISSWWVNIHGHRHPHVVEAITRQLQTFDQVPFTEFTHAPAIQLAKTLSQLLPGKEPKRFFFSDNGSTAVEAALKMAIQFWKNAKQTRNTIVAFHKGYHGETMGAMSVSCPTLFTGPFKEYLFHVERIDPPTLGKEEQSLQQMQQILQKKRVAAFIFEPILQGAGGMVPHSLKYLSALMQLCKEQNVFTIADEVFTGCGRLGPHFASELLDAPPDLICLAKSVTNGTIPLGITACTPLLFEQFLSTKKEKAFLHGHSYCANPVGCAAALATLHLLTQETCQKKRAWIEREHRQKKKELENRKEIHRIDVTGTIFALEYASPEKKKGYFHPKQDLIAQFFFERGIYMRPLGNVVYIVPPYCISPSQLEKIYQTIEESLCLATS